MHTQQASRRLEGRAASQQDAGGTTTTTTSSSRPAVDGVGLFPGLPVSGGRVRARSHQPQTSIEQYEQLVGDVDPEDEESDATDEDAEEEAEEEEEEEEEGVDSAAADEEADADATAAEEEREQQDLQQEEAAAVMADAQLGLDLANFPAFFGYDPPLSSFPLADDEDFFPVHVATLQADDADEVLFADSGTTTPTHAARRLSGRRASYGYAHAPSADGVPLWPTEASPPASSRQTPRVDRAGQSIPSPRSSASGLRRHSQVESPALAALPGLVGAVSRPMSADIERRRSLERLPSASRLLVQQAAEAASPAAALFAAPTPPKRAPFHRFGNGPVAVKPGAATGSPTSPPAAHVSPLPPVNARQRPLLAASSTSTAPVRLSSSVASTSLAHSKNQFPARPLLPPRSEFPDFPSSSPSALPSTFSAAPSQPVALVALPDGAGRESGALFELPVGYEIIRSKPPLASGRPSSSSSDQRGGGPGDTPTGLARASVAIGPVSTHAPFLQRAMSDVLARLAGMYGVARALPPADAADASVIIIEETGGKPATDEDELAEASISFADVDATSRPSSAVRDRQQPPQQQPQQQQAGSAATVAPSAIGGVAQVKCLSSFIQDAFDEIEVEGGTPRESRTPADSLKLNVNSAGVISSEDGRTSQQQAQQSARVRPSAMVLPESTLRLHGISRDAPALADAPGQLVSVGDAPLDGAPAITPISSMPTSPLSVPSALERERESQARVFAVSAALPGATPSSPLAPLGKQKAWAAKKSALASQEGALGVSFDKEPPTAKSDAKLEKDRSSKAKRSASKKAATGVLTAAAVVRESHSSPTNPAAFAKAFKNLNSGSVRDSIIVPASLMTAAAGSAPAPAATREKERDRERDRTEKEKSKEMDLGPSVILSSSKDASVGVSSVSGVVSGSSQKVAKKVRKKKVGASKVKRLTLAPRGTLLTTSIPSAPIRCLTVVGDEVWTCEKDGALVIRDAVTGEPLPHGRIHQTNTIFTALAYAAGWVWAGTDAGALLRFDPKSREIIAPPSGGLTRSFTAGINILRYDGKDRLFVGSQDHMLRSWNAHTGAYLRTYTGHTLDVRAILCMGFTQVWSASADGTIRIFDVEKGECMFVLHGHTDAVTCLVSVGFMVVSGSADGTLRAWKMAGGGPTSVVHSADGFHQLLPGVGPTGPGALASSPPLSVDRPTVAWECVQTVDGGVGRISSMLLVNSNHLWTVGQSERVGVWSVAPATGLITRAKGVMPPGGHSSFISGVSLVRRTEVKSIWTHSTSTTSGVGESDAGDKLCLWTHTTHNGKDPTDQLQLSRNMSLTLRWHFQRIQRAYQLLQHQVDRERRVFQQELQRLVLYAAEHRASTLAEQDGAHTLQVRLDAKSARCVELGLALAGVRGELESMRASHAQLEIAKLEQTELHEEYATNLKKVIHDKTRQRDQLEDHWRHEAELLQAQLEAEEKKANEANRRADAAERRANEFEQLVQALRAEALAATAQSRQSASRLAELESSHASLRSSLSPPSSSPSVSSDQLARDLGSLSRSVDRARKSLVEGVSKPLRLLTTATLFDVGSQVTANAHQLQADWADAAAQVKAIIAQHLTDAQRHHIGVAGQLAPTHRHEGGTATTTAAAAAPAPAPPMPSALSPP